MISQGEQKKECMGYIDTVASVMGSVVASQHIRTVIFFHSSIHIEASKIQNRVSLNFTKSG
jgi:hypothetical protein